MTTAIPRVLSIAGTDPTGGAGIQADLKSIAAAGGYGMCVVTSLVAQNTQGVRSIHTPPQEFLKEQLDAVFDDVEVDAIKIGMLGDAETTATVSEALAGREVPVVVVDPVMVATSGDRLLSEDAEAALRQFVRDHATVVTPNIPELAVLTENEPAADFDEAVEQGKAYAAATGVAVLVKGGHLSGDASNALVSPDGSVEVARVPRVDTKNTHGTGCSLSSALATRLALGSEAGSGAGSAAAVRWASDWLYEAIANADALGVGKGNGPVDHSHRARRLAAAASTQPWDLSGDRPAGETGQLLAAKIPAAGPHTQALWDRAAAKVWPDTLNLPFITALRSGDLAEDDFEFYLLQDAHYLEEYARALAQVGIKAHTPDDQVWWANSSAEAIHAEAELHRTWFAQHDLDHASSRPSPVTNAYTDFLVSETAVEEYAVGAAAVLPCFWLYAEVGLHLAENNHADHPYNAWLSMYGGDDFVGEVKQALDATERALEEASPAARKRAAEAFMYACYHELAFFDQASRRA
ncbi:bifunctional hydroxymethylpyrimidine kinase/phosphomethylpyrimidine kinase [Corynebacterium aquatimens]|uniref:Thiamine biosynthesis multifunctional protein ThiED n=1 Tax=Corynebacterium aquatimens TaxID=1190508 RepID=A0A931E1H7_9CORY|nr:bifunctional hydroxymethylpyrimidine kinase/phosphomethylpyrimidine kinase [Corynebacterium aquatimens]MBG6123004.1 hydroxymethylpyrimidine kinase/phosphomethylpyrimidine kinase [Corynebacterium aquatimens]WJY66662.1 Hydroxymethylpyrimidine/phosphomethylpyrimidine kinase [Corynebacterium aquatimens]